MEAANDEPVQTDAGQRTFGQFLDDEKLENVIEVNLKKASPALKKDSNITVTVYNEVVLLSGQVPTHVAKNLAGETAQKVNRVRQVHNELNVQATRRFTGKTRDSWLRGKVESKLIHSDQIEADRIKVIVANEIVYLMGLVTSKEADTITNITRSTKGIKKIVRVFEYID